MASARWRTRERKNSWPMPAAVPSTTARRACRSSRTAETTGESPALVGARRGSCVNGPAACGSGVMRHLQARGLWTQACSAQERRSTGGLAQAPSPDKGLLSYSIRFSGEADTAVRKGPGTAVQLAGGGIRSVLPSQPPWSTGRGTGPYGKARQRLPESLLRRLVRDRVNPLHEQVQAATDLAEYGRRG